MSFCIFGSNSSNFGFWAAYWVNGILFLIVDMGNLSYWFCWVIVVQSKVESGDGIYLWLIDLLFSSLSMCSWFMHDASGVAFLVKRKRNHDVKLCLQFCDVGKSYEDWIVWLFDDVVFCWNVWRGGVSLIVVQVFWLKDFFFWGIFWLKIGIWQFHYFLETIKCWIWWRFISTFGLMHSTFGCRTMIFVPTWICFVHYCFYAST